MSILFFFVFLVFTGAEKGELFKELTRASAAENSFISKVQKKIFFTQLLKGFPISF